MNVHIAQLRLQTKTRVATTLLDPRFDSGNESPRRINKLSVQASDKIKKKT